ncbi:hypothetical protein GQ42DRAFT_178565 [Ramicandelaber brevisporus]|nr:hypothetical protein GQ42DRAFT_178565 [Ramicandelaber brevisporus]
MCEKHEMVCSERDDMTVATHSSSGSGGGGGGWFEHLSSRLATLSSSVSTTGYDAPLPDSLLVLVRYLESCIAAEHVRRRQLLATSEDTLVRCELLCNVLGITLSNAARVIEAERGIIVDSEVDLSSLIGYENTGVTPKVFSEAMVRVQQELEIIVNQRVLLAKLSSQLIRELCDEMVEASTSHTSSVLWPHGVDDQGMLRLLQSNDSSDIQPWMLLDRGRIASLDTCVQQLERMKAERVARFNAAMARISTMWSRVRAISGRKSPGGSTRIRSNSNENADRHDDDDPLDVCLENLFERSGNQAVLFGIVYERSRGRPLSLAAADLAGLDRKARELEILVMTQHARLGEICRSIRKLWDDLDEPAEERFTLPTDADVARLVAAAVSASSVSSNTATAVAVAASTQIAAILQLVEKLDEVHAGLRRRFLEKFEALLQQCESQLTPLWDACAIPPAARTSTMVRIREHSHSEKEIRYLCKNEMSRLETLLAKRRPILDMIGERSVLIERMIEFERSASDPRRLFQASFRLVEEEKFRKSCYPTLVALESKLIDSLEMFELENGSKFYYCSATNSAASEQLQNGTDGSNNSNNNNNNGGGDNGEIVAMTARARRLIGARNYLDVLRDEIENRLVNETVFGFGASATTSTAHSPFGGAGGDRLSRKSVHWDDDGGLGPVDFGQSAAARLKQALRSTPVASSARQSYAPNGSTPTPMSHQRRGSQSSQGSSRAPSAATSPRSLPSTVSPSVSPASVASVGGSRGSTAALPPLSNKRLSVSSHQGPPLVVINETPTRTSRTPLTSPRSRAQTLQDELSSVNSNASDESATPSTSSRSSLSVQSTTPRSRSGTLSTSKPKTTPTPTVVGKRTASMTQQPSRRPVSRLAGSSSANSSATPASTSSTINNNSFSSSSSSISSSRRRVSSANRSSFISSTTTSTNQR